MFLLFCLSEKETTDTCVPNPCGPNSVCQVRGESPACSCLETYIGLPPNCRPECTINPECPSHLACINQKCRDVCTGSCGSNTVCNVVNHSPACSCIHGFTGDPFSNCISVPGKFSKHLSRLVQYQWVLWILIQIYYFNFLN